MKPVDGTHTTFLVRGVSHRRLGSGYRSDTRGSSLLKSGLNFREKNPDGRDSSRFRDDSRELSG